MFLFILSIQHTHDNECWFPFLYTRRVIVTDCAQHSKLETCQFFDKFYAFVGYQQYSYVLYLLYFRYSWHNKKMCFIFQNVSWSEISHWYMNCETLVKIIYRPERNHTIFSNCLLNEFRFQNNVGKFPMEYYYSDQYFRCFSIHHSHC